MIAFSLVILALQGGCFGSSAPKTIPVQGKVSYKGQPVSQGTVTFHRVEAANDVLSRPAVGELKSDGTYALSTFTAGDGVMPGKYQVVVVSITSAPSPEEPNVREVWGIPRKYGDPAQSGLTAEVAADARGPLNLDFTLED